MTALHASRCSTDCHRWETADVRGRIYTSCDLCGHASAEGWWGELYLDPALDRTARQLDLCLIAAGQQSSGSTCR